MDYQQQMQAVKDKAATVYAAFNDSERHGVRFGLFPAVKMRAAESELKAAGCDRQDVGRLLSVALMDCK